MIEIRVISKLVNGERLVDAAWTLERLAEKLESVTGIPPASQSFEFIAESGSSVPVPNEDRSVTLTSIGIADGWEIHVKDLRPPEEIPDFETVEDSEEASYELPKEEYEKRADTVLQWKKANKLGRFADTSGAEHAEYVRTSQTAQTKHNYGEVAVPLKSECFVRLVSGKTVRGTVEFIGEVHNIAPGTWVGVRLISPEGKNNGTVKGVHLFDAETNHGALVRPEAVRPLDEDEEEI